ncbi:MAG: ABC transporter ATP-binding protein [Actinomycetota bacterium]|nr:ABC transporter ATP-binding protein [Actinomycetota bacterium]
MTENPVSGPAQATDMTPPAQHTSTMLEIANLTTSLFIDGRPQLVVRGMNLTVSVGEVVGLVGESGSGKSITARSVIGLLPRGSKVEGRIRVGDVDRLAMSRQELRQLRAETVAMIFQDPQAHIDPLWRVEDYVGEGLRIHQGVSKSVARERSAALLTSMGIMDAERVLHSYPGQLSGGMLQRVMIAGALSCEPQLIIADEATTALDVTVQSDILAILNELRRTRHMSLLFITHDLGLASVICDRIVVMYAGQAMVIQDSAGLFAAPAHPYAAALVGARPDPDRRVARLRSVEGRSVSALEAPSGCPFRSRCPYAIEDCADAPMTLEPIGPGVSSACIRIDEIRPRLAQEVAPRD